MGTPIYLFLLKSSLFIVLYPLLLCSKVTQSCTHTHTHIHTLTHSHTVPFLHCLPSWFLPRAWREALCGSAGPPCSSILTVASSLFEAPSSLGLGTLHSCGCLCFTSPLFSILPFPRWALHPSPLHDVFSLMPITRWHSTHLAAVSLLTKVHERSDFIILFAPRT